MKVEFRVVFKLPNRWNETKLNEFLQRAEHNLRTHYTHGPNLKTKYHPDVVRIAEIDFRNKEKD